MMWESMGKSYRAQGNLGEYVVTPRIKRGALAFVATVKIKRRSVVKGLGEFSSLENAKSAAATYENYRAAWSASAARPVRWAARRGRIGARTGGCDVEFYHRRETLRG